MTFSWKKALAPEKLFLAGTIFALLPYFFWKSDWGLDLVRGYPFEIDVRPALLWVSGFMSFWTGAKLWAVYQSFTGRSVLPDTDFEYNIRSGRLRLVLLVLLIVVSIQTAMVISFFGVIPIVAFASENFYTVDTVNAQQVVSSFGQLGFLFLSNSLMVAVLLAAFVSRHKFKTIDKVLILSAILLLLFVSLFQGKRQGLFMAVSFFFSGLALARGRVVSPFFEKMMSRRLSRIKTFIFVGVIVGALFILMGFISALRYGYYREYSFKKSADEIAFYLSLPLLNMHSNVEHSGLNGFQFNPKALLAGLLPYKLRESIQYDFDDQPMPLLETSCGAGFIGTVHWSVGLWGLIGFCAFCGAFSRAVYSQINKDIFYLLVYCQMVWALIAAHTYIHFLTLLFFPLPVVLFFFLSRFLVGGRA